jgi:hypothetical protein
MDLAVVVLYRALLVASDASAVNPGIVMATRFYSRKR